MLEVLVAIFILTLGLLGTAAMQSQMQATQVEAYQRAVHRAAAGHGRPRELEPQECKRVRNRVASRHKLAGLRALTAVADKDKCEWNNALFGAASSKAPKRLAQ